MNYKKSDKANFLKDVKNYEHTFLRKKLIMGNKAPCRTRKLRKEIYISSVLRNKFFEDRTKENEKLYKK